MVEWMRHSISQRSDDAAQACQWQTVTGREVVCVVLVCNSSLYIGDANLPSMQDLR